MSSNQPESNAQTTYKEQLDLKAGESFNREKQEEESQPSLVEKATETVKEYVPGAAQAIESLGGTDKQADKEVEALEQDVVGGQKPERPVHDENIQEFVRDQHRSKKEDIANAGA